MRRTAFMLGVILAVGIGVGEITDHDLNAQPTQTSKIPVNGVELNYVEQGAGDRSSSYTVLSGIFVPGSLS